ncbi:MAG: fimbrillin family protein [Prevotella sp.]|uniref:fimbrillin family protein n=1 Tax=Prevotella sp. TaxID=59823 RepID=UPI0025EB5132|nr:fimbrillin family protein [Prevotella sp.]MCI7183242.1 fimbrillin family protein [Prevotella sp.]
MKKTLLLALAAVATIFTSCSSDITNDNDDSNNGQGKGMTLIANVEQDDTRATFEPNDTIGSTWKFTYTDNDKVYVGNDKINKYYTFTKNGETFSSTEAKATNSNANWYAYYPGTEINLTGQDGTKESAAKLYALAGATTTATTGADGLAINMKPQAAVLRIVKVDNYGPCDIYLKTKDGYVSGLTAKKDQDGFDVKTSKEKVSVFKKNNTDKAGIYYVIVPAGVKIEVWNDTKLIKTTKDKGLSAGKYYTLTSGPTYGTATATINGETRTIEWVQMWIGGPRFAKENVAKKMSWTEAAKTGSAYVWGANWRTPTKDEMDFVDKDGYTTKTENVEVDNVIENDVVTKFKYIGVQPGYTNNIMYLPSTASESHGGVYWSSTDAGYDKDGHELGWCLNMIVDNKDTHTHFFVSLKKDAPYAVRPVLTKETVLWGEQDIK